MLNSTATSTTLCHSEPTISSSTGTTSTLNSEVFSFLAFLSSLSAFRDWAKFIVLGGAAETIRRLLYVLWGFFLNSIVVTAEFDHNDDTYTWMMVWLAKQKSWNAARSVQISTYRYGQSGKADQLPGEDPECSPDKKKLVSFQPTLDTSQYIWHKNSLLECTLFQRDETFSFWKTDRLKIRALTFNRDFLHTLLLDAKRTYKTEVDERIDIYVVDPQKDEWILAGSRPKRNLASVVLDKNVKEHILQDAREFLASELWYADRGIPWRRGYLLHGCPGSGKTSLIHALAGELNLGIYILSMSMQRLDDAALHTLVSRLPTKSIALIEDIDVAFYRGLNREKQEASSSGHNTASPTSNVSSSTGPIPGLPQQQSTGGPNITLAGLLAAIDGVSAQEGRILFASTNKYDALDPALTRPGRLDVHIEFGNATHWQMKKLYEQFFNDTLDAERHDDHRCSGKDDASISEQSLICFDDKDELSLFGRRDREEDNDREDANGPKEISSVEVSRLAEMFAAQIPEYEFSMAAIQGYLMKYKTTPRLAIAEAAPWVEKEQTKKRERETNRDGTDTKPRYASLKSLITESLFEHLNGPLLAI